MMRDKLAQVIKDSRVEGQNPRDLDLADAIIAALPGMVKPLEWFHPYARTSGELIAETLLNNVFYSITEDRGRFWLKVRGSVSITGISTFDSLEAAQAAANEHHRAAIMRALGL